MKHYCVVSPSLMSVSYTHLDVYKRQVYNQQVENVVAQFISSLVSPCVPSEYSFCVTGYWLHFVQLSETFSTPSGLIAQTVYLAVALLNGSFKVVFILVSFSLAFRNQTPSDWITKLKEATFVLRHKESVLRALIVANSKLV